MKWNERTAALLGNDAVEKLKNSHVAVFGIGGVGSYVAEALVRAGVGRLTFIDGDVVGETNLNRQLVALRSTMGKYKTHVMRDRALDINPDARVTTLELFYCAESADKIDFSAFDYVADAIDMVNSKLLIAEKCHAANVPLISSMGAGNRKDPSLFRVTDVFGTSGCPLARRMRKGLKARGIYRLNVVFSPEEPLVPDMPEEERKIGSLPFVPSVAGLIMAGKIINDISEGQDHV